MTPNYPLNLFSSEIKSNLIEKLDNSHTLTREDFLRSNAMMVLMHLWEPWDEAFWSQNLFDKSMFSKIKKNYLTLSAFHYALLKKSDPFFLKAARIEIQAILNRLQTTLTMQSPSNETQRLKVELAIANFLSIFVMFNPSPHETLHIPQLINQEWKNIEFKIEPIELSPTNGIWSIPLTQTDRLFSYGFTPLNSVDAPRILAHCGTGWPTAQGVDIQILADLWPNKTPGEVFFEWQHSALNTWLDSETSKVITLGQSLGGSLAYLTAMHRPNKIIKAICLVPPGMLTDYDAHHTLFGDWDKMLQKDRPEVIIQKQSYDPVSKFGSFKKDFSLIKIKLLKEKMKPNPLSLLSAHARNFAACDHIEITKLDIETENQCAKRLANNYWLYEKRTLVFNGLLVPYFFLIKPLKKFFGDNAFVISTTLLLLVSCLVSPPFATLILSLPLIPTLTPLFLSYLLGSYCISSTLERVFQLTFDLFFNELLSIKNYIEVIEKQNLFDGFKKVMFDVINVLSFNFPNIVISFVTIIKEIIQKLFFEYTPKACPIHSVEYNQATNDLNAYTPPSIEEKLQTLGLIILLYSVLLPIKFICYDIPSFLNACYNQAPYPSKIFKDKLESKYTFHFFKTADIHKQSETIPKYVDPLILSTYGVL